MWSTLVSLFLLLLLPVPASADTCDVAAAKVARETGAKLDETFLTKLPNSRILVHPQFGDLDMVCGPSDRPGRLEITIRVATAFPDDAYFKTVAKAGGAVSGASPSDVARAAAACQILLLLLPHLSADGGNVIGHDYRCRLLADRLGGGRRRSI